MVPDVTDFLFRLRFSIFFSTSSPPSRLPDALPYMYDSICARSSLGTCENGEIIRGLRAKRSKNCTSADQGKGTGMSANKRFATEEAEEYNGRD